MKIPSYDKAVGPDSQRVAAPRANEPVQDAFGAREAAALGQLGEEVKRQAQYYGAWRAREQEREALKRAGDTFISYQDRINKVLYGEKDDQGNQLKDGLMTRKMGNAKGATLQYRQEAQTLQREFLSRAKTKFEQDYLTRAIGQHERDAYDAVARHEAAEAARELELKTDAVLERHQQTAALIYDPARMRAELDAAGGFAAKSWDAQGLPQDAKALKRQELATAMVGAGVQTMTQNGNTALARQMLESFRTELAPAAVSKMDKTIRAAEIDQYKDHIWQALQFYAGPTGEVSLAEAQKLIAQQKTTPREKREIFNYIEAKNRDAAAVYAQQKDQNDERFFADADQAKSQGAGLADALKLAESYAFGPSDKITKQRFIRQYFAAGNAPDKEDARVFVQLRDGINAGRYGRAEVDRAFDRGLINAASYKSLTRASTRGAQKLGKYQAQAVDAAIDRRFLKEFSNDKKAQADFKYAFAKTVAEQGMENDFQKQLELVDKLMLPARDARTVAEKIADADRTRTTLAAELDAQFAPLGAGFGETVAELFRQGALKEGKLPERKAWVKLMQKFGQTELETPGTLQNDALTKLLAEEEPITEDALSKTMYALYRANEQLPPPDRRAYDPAFINRLTRLSENAVYLSEHEDELRQQGRRRPGEY